MPGWSDCSWGYHGDDGKKYAKGYGSRCGPLYGTGDFIGCGTHLGTGDVFFTKNGENLGKIKVDVYTNIQKLTGMQEPLSPISRVGFSRLSDLVKMAFVFLSILGSRSLFLRYLVGDYQS